MNAPIRTGDLLTAEEVIGQFFAPATADMVDALVGQYQQARERIAEVSAFVDARFAAVCCTTSWQAHIEHASTMLAANGRLVAILPASAKGKEVLPGWAHEWSQVFENQFAGTSVDVVIMVAERQ